jgi:hypothetical protein
MNALLKSWIESIVTLFRVPAAQTAEGLLLNKLDLQFFAGEDSGDSDGGEGDSQGDDQDDPDDEDGGDDDEPDQEPELSQMLKDDPKLKKQFNQLFKSKFDKRLKGVDLKKARELLAKEQEKQQQEDQDKDDAADAAAKIAKRQEKLDRKAKRLAVKEYAADQGQNPKLIARLVDLDALELNEDGEVDEDDLEEAFDDIKADFPELFAEPEDNDDEDDDEEERSRTKHQRSAYRPGSRQRGNKKPKHGGYEAGKARALARHPKKEG